MTFREIIDSIEKLSIEDQDKLFELVIKRRAEALAMAQQVSEMTARMKARGESFGNARQNLLDDDFL
jgi:DNA topoisomerase IA